MDADTLLASVPTAEQAAVRTSWKALRARIASEARAVPEDREDLREEKRDWLKRWGALLVELKALCSLGEHVGKPLTPFEDFEADELDVVRAALFLQKAWSAVPTERPIVGEEVPIATLPVARSSSPPAVESSEYNGKGTENEVGDDSVGEGVDELEPRETRASARKRALVKKTAAPLPKGMVIHKPPCRGCSRALGETVCQGRRGEKCFSCRKGHKFLPLRVLLKGVKLSTPNHPLSAFLTPDELPSTSASKRPTRSPSSKGKGIVKPAAGGNLSARREQQLRSSETVLKNMASSLFNQAEELRFLREAEFGSS
ncbi:hypothetical protein EDB19DRAFT_1916844 [Suillus lakei]|nr:hypothetical protein EDB19DRAFT_1916844 [Suillus lakei]